MFYVLRHNCTIDNTSQNKLKLTLLCPFPDISFVIMRSRAKDFTLLNGYSSCPAFLQSDWLTIGQDSAMDSTDEQN